MAPAAAADSDDEQAWREGEAHVGEPWMHDGEPGPRFWRIDQRRHVDVARAVALLQGPAAGADDEHRRRHWLTEIERNNTVIVPVVSPVYPRGRPAEVVLDVRNADRLAVRLYRLPAGDAPTAGQNPLYVAHVAVEDLKTLARRTQHAPGRRPASCWRCDRLVTIPPRRLRPRAAMCSCSRPTANERRRR